MNTNTDTRFPNQAFPNNQPSSSKKGWLFGGCGCLSLIGILCLGGGGFAYMKWIKPGIDFVAEATTIAAENPQVKETLGEPLVVDHNNIKQEVGQQSIFLRIPVKGSQGSGTVVAEGRISTSGVISPGPMKLEFDGETIDLDPDAATPVPDIKIGDD
jgi:hypothetical protein